MTLLCCLGITVACVIAEGLRVCDGCGFHRNDNSAPTGGDSAAVCGQGSGEEAVPCDLAATYAIILCAREQQI